jgi:hypothetical protein
MTEQEMVRAVVAEMRAADLVSTLRHAVAGESHWRLEAKRLLDDIDNGVLRPSCKEALREADAKKRAAEILADVCDDICP